MDEKRLKETLEKAFPDTPAVFHNRLAAVAEGQRQEEKMPMKKMIFRVALVGLLVLSMTGGALAAMNHYGVLNFNAGWQESHYFTLPGAENMIHYDLAEAQTGGLLWKVKEAAYDGRVLRVIYSVQDTAAAARLTGDAIIEAYQALCEKNGVCLKADGNGEIFVNDQPVNLESLDARYGEGNGEIEYWFDCRLEGYHGLKLLPEGTITVSMPFAFKNDAARESAQADALSFTMDVGDAASRYSLSLPAPYDLGNGAVLALTDAHFSPVNVFIDGSISFKESRELQVPDEKDFEAMEAFLEGLPEYAAYFDAHLENADGETLGESRDGFIGHNISDDGAFTLIFRYENTPSDKYTDVNYLCLGDWRVPIPMAYKTK